MAYAWQPLKLARLHLPFSSNRNPLARPQQQRQGNDGRKEASQQQVVLILPLPHTTVKGQLDLISESRRLSPLPSPFLLRMMMKRKHLSDIANHVLHGCARELRASVDSMVEEFEASWKPEMGDYSRKLVEFCCSKAICNMCSNIEQMISGGLFSRFTFDMMLAWQMHSSDQEESYTEGLAKEKEEKRITIEATHEQDEIPLFYSDLMPLLVDHEPSVKEDAFVWFGTLVPLAVDMVNGRFTFETLTAPTANQLYFPGYDKYLKEIDKYIKQLRKQATPKGVELADDEFILHVEGTLSTQRVVRHIGGTSWPGRLTLTNYALYFEASGVISYEDALRLDLSKDAEQRVKPAATGPWGAPLFDKAIVYESTDLQEAVVLEFPEITSSTRRDHWLALVKEVMLLHQFLSKYNLESPAQAWEMHSRTILGVIRLHAAREMLRISPPDPKSFLIFALFAELPKGDYVLDELAENSKKVDSGHPCSASSILRCMNVSQQVAFNLEIEKGSGQMTTVRGQAADLSPLENAINQVREETREIDMAKATTEGLKDEGISDSIFVLMELLKPLKNVGPWCQEILSWERPLTTIIVITISLLTVYKEWVGKALAACLLWVVGKMLWARKERIGEKCNKVVACTATNQTTMESIVSAQHGLNTVHALVQRTNISILKIWSIFVSRAPKQANMVMMAMTGTAVMLAVVPMKFILMALLLCGFTATRNMGKHVANANNSNTSSQGNRRLKEWWDSIPVVPIEVVDQIPAGTQTQRPSSISSSSSSSSSSS